MHITRGLLFSVALAMGSPAWSAPIDCNVPAAGNVERAICASPALIASDRAIAGVFARRLMQCPPRQRALLRQTQKFWLRDRNACANALSDGEGAMERCVAARMAERTAQLDRIGDTCDLDSVAGQYRYVDADYLSRNAAHYVGRDVWVWGGVKLSSCDVHSSSLTAKLESMPGNGGSFAIRYKAMPALKREWLCAQHPASHWHGTVRQDAGGFYLYLTDVLGDPL